MKQMTLFDMSSNSAKKSNAKDKDKKSPKKCPKNLPSISVKTPKNSPSKIVKTSNEKHTLKQLKKTDSKSKEVKKKKLKMARNSLKKAMLEVKTPKKKQRLLFTTVKSPLTSSDAKAQSNAPLSVASISYPVNIQKLKFRQLMKK